MKEAEFKVLVMTLRTFYAKEKLFPNDQALELWFNMMKDLPYDVTAKVVAEWTMEHEWSPAVSDIIKGVTAKLREMFPEDKTEDWGEAYDKTIKVIRELGFYRQQEALEALDEMTKSVINGIGGFAYLCMSENPEQDRANFRMLYEERRKRKEEHKTSDLSKLIAKYQEKLTASEQGKIEAE